MGTKIYEAYRIPIPRLNEFIDIARAGAWTKAYKVTDNLITIALKENNITFDSMPPHIKELAAREGAEKVWNAYKNSKGWNLIEDLVVNREGKDPLFNLTCGLNIWLRNGRAYIIPIGSYMDLSISRLPGWVEDYCYFNNVDRPEEITSRQWKQREKTWEKINLGRGVSDHNARRLYHAILDSTFMGLFEFSKKYVGELWDIMDGERIRRNKAEREVKKNKNG